MECLTENEQAVLNALRLTDSSADEILHELDRICAHEIFERATKARNFLRYVVAMKMLGCAEAIKETTIAAAVWREAANFNPLEDNKIRMAAIEIRKKLAEYYGGHGRYDPIEIWLPDRGYVPEIMDRHVAIAAFENWNPGGDQSHLCAVVRDEIALRLNGANRPRSEPAMDLESGNRSSGYGLRGSLEDLSGILRLNVSLSHRQTARIILSQAFEAKRDDIFKLSRQVAEAVLEGIAAESPEARQHRSKQAPEKFETLHLYQQGRSQLRKRTATSIRRAMELFEQAIEANPQFARAYAGLAECYLLLSWYELSTPDRIWFEAAKGHALTAVELNPELPEVHTALAYAKLLCDFDWAGAEADFHRAIRRDNRYAPAHHWYGNLLVMQGRFAEAQAEMKRAFDLDSGSIVIRKAVGDPYYYSRSYEKAIESYLAVLNIDSTFWMAHLFLGLACEQMGRKDDAIKAFEAAATHSGSSTVVQGAIGHLFAASGCPAKALSIIDLFKAQPEAPFVAPHTLAVIYTALGDRDQAFEWLNASYENRIELLSWIKVDPRFDALHNDPRWSLFLENIGLPL
jgi:tetratricopeptide (TPR) repeat protein